MSMREQSGARLTPVSGIGRAAFTSFASEPIAQHHTLDLSSCAAEPIHIPGTIQPHGVLIAADPSSGLITHVSANIESSTGLAPTMVLGRALHDLIGAASALALSATLNNERYGTANYMVLTLAIPINPRRTVLAHRYKGHLLLELEDVPSDDEHQLAITRAQSIFAMLRRAETAAELCDDAVRHLRRLTSYDRVMIYCFDAQGDGTVVAEARDNAIEPYLNLRYPASDIPAQARKLYVQQRVRAIPDSHYLPVPVLAIAGAPDHDLDMTFCALRGVSPIHCEYLRNMDVRGTLAVSLLQDGMLSGMIICHHRTPRAVSAETRALADVIGQLVSILLVKLREAEKLSEQLERQHSLEVLREDLVSSSTIIEGLLRCPGALLDLVGASGAALRVEGQTVSIGATPPEQALDALFGAMRKAGGDTVAAISDAGLPGGIAEPHAACASGMLLMPINNDPDDGILWFRHEMVETVNWAGDPRKAVEILPATSAAAAPVRISPRKSFAVWQEERRGQAVPWSENDLQAAHSLRRDIMAALLRQAEARLALLSAFDPLTGLANARMLEAHIGHWAQSSGEQPSALVLLDIDRFTAVRDSLGHAASDAIVQEIAARLSALTGPDDMVARLGEDIFALFRPGAEGPAAEALSTAILNECSRPIPIQDNPFYITVSVALACAQPGEARDLLRDTESAMLAAKREGGARMVRFDARLHPPTFNKIQIEQALFEALPKNQISVQYQPIVRASDGAIIGFESLLRWHHPSLGWISPGIFIPLAESNGLIRRIGTMVLETAIEQAALWQRDYPGLTMSINVSPVQLTEASLSTLVAGIVARTGIAPETITLEVTESVLMQEEAVRDLHRVRASGVKVALDDFGTGYSSLAYLHKLPLDKVKIDRSFVIPLSSDAKADRFFRAVIDLAHTLDLQTIAEGCETAAQWQAIGQSGCDLVQGWLVSRAMPADEARAFLQRHTWPADVDCESGAPSAQTGKPIWQMVGATGIEPVTPAV